MLKLNRKGAEVFDESGNKLTIVAQATKGAGKESVKIAGLAGSNGAKWISLSKLQEGWNEVEPTAREVTTSQKYQLTADEAAEVKQLQARIDEIINAAKARYVAVPKLNCNVEAMSEAEKLAKIEELKKYLGI